MTHRVVVAGEPAWRKEYGTGRRRLRLGVLDVATRLLGLGPLRPPPHHGGARAAQVERRRIEQLAALDVQVPRIVGENRNALLLSDIGPSLSSRLRECAGDPERIDGLVASAIAAIGEAHRKGAYFGQPWPRNLTFRDGRVGFLDFEEDPLEIMSLEQAQARDWLLFVYGTTRFYRERPDALARMLRDALRAAPAEVSAPVAEVGERLQPLARLFRGMGSSARTLWQSLSVIRSVTRLPLLVAAVWLGVDWLGDGELDLLLMLAQV